MFKQRIDWPFRDGICMWCPLTMPCHVPLGPCYPTSNIALMAREMNGKSSNIRIPTENIFHDSSKFINSPLYVPPRSDLVEAKFKHIEHLHVNKLFMKLYSMVPYWLSISIILIMIQHRIGHGCLCKPTINPIHWRTYETCSIANCVIKEYTIYVLVCVCSDVYFLHSQHCPQWCHGSLLSAWINYNPCMDK